MTGLRAIVVRALVDADLLLGDRHHERFRSEAFRAGKRLLLRADRSLSDGGAVSLPAAARSLELSDAALARMLGFGWYQADGLAELAATAAALRPEVARLGALFNLGIALFDRVCDRHPERAPVLFSRISPEFLEAQLSGRGARLPATGDAAVDLLVALVEDLFTRSRALGGDAQDQRGFAELIHAMYRGQRFSAEVHRDRAGPTLGTWRELRRKSALPIATMAQLALLAQADANDRRRATVRAAASMAGDAIWIADDLADIGEDWTAGCWSRPLWILTRRTGSAPADPASAIAQLVETGVAAAETQRLASKLDRLRRIAGTAGAAFSGSLQATVRAWVDELPE